MNNTKTYMVITLALFLCLFSTIVFAETDGIEFDLIDWDVIDSVELDSESIQLILDSGQKNLFLEAAEAYRNADYEQAIRLYLATARLGLLREVSIYNIACCFGLLGKEDEAAKVLKRAVDEGFSNLELIMNDGDFEKVRDSDVFKKTMDTVEIELIKRQESLGKKFHLESPASYYYRIHFPENYDPDKRYPLVVGLHSYSSVPERFIGLWEWLKGIDIIYVCPQGMYPIPTTKGIGYGWGLYEGGYSEITDQMKMQSGQYVADVVKTIRRDYKVADTYLLGFSEGCAMTYLSGIKNQTLFDGLICFGGWLDEDKISEKDIRLANGLKVLIAHGQDEGQILKESSKRAFDLLEKYNYDVMIFDYPGKHELTKESMVMVVEWLKKNFK